MESRLYKAGITPPPGYITRLAGGTAPMQSPFSAIIRWLQHQKFSAALANTFTAAQTTSPGFINNYYDDEGWWALAWVNAYDLTHTPQYLQMAQSIFADMAGGWDTATCGGGIWWSKDKTYKNAIANELFLSVAAHLANRTSGPQKEQYANGPHRNGIGSLHQG